MAAKSSYHESILEDLTKEIEKQTADLNKYREKIININRGVEDLKIRKLEEAKLLEKVKKIEREKEELIASLEEEGKIEEFLASYKEMKSKVKVMIKDSDWKKIKSITDSKRKKGKIDELENQLKELGKQYDENSTKLKCTEKIVKDKEEGLTKAKEELNKLLHELKSLKQKLVLDTRSILSLLTIKKSPSRWAFILMRWIRPIKRLRVL